MVAFTIIKVLIFLFVIIVVLLMVVAMSSRFKKLPPSKAMAVWVPGAKGGMLVVPYCGILVLPGTRTAVLDLRLRYLDLVLSDVKMDVGGSERMARVRMSILYKLSSEDRALKNSFGTIKDKTDKEVEDILRDTVGAAAREEMAKTTLERAYRDRDNLTGLVQRRAEQPLAVYGLEIRAAAIAEMGPRDR